MKGTQFDPMPTDDRESDHRPLDLRHRDEGGEHRNDERYASCISMSLHLVCADGNLQLAKALVARRADPNLKDRWGNEPLKYAMREGNAEMVEFLEQAGALCSNKSRVDLSYKYCRSAAEGDIQTMRRLLAGKVSIDAVDYDHKSALQLAASNGQDNVVKFLVAARADVNYQDSWSKTAMDHAVQGGHFSVQEILRRAGVSIFDSPEPSAKRHRTGNEERGFGRTRSNSTGNIIEAIQIKKKEEIASHISTRRNSCGSSGTDAALLAMSDMASKTARYLTAKGATLDADIRWASGTVSLSSEEAVVSKDCTEKRFCEQAVDFERNSSASAGRDISRRCCISFDSDGIRVIGIAQSAQAYDDGASRLAIQDRNHATPNSPLAGNDASLPSGGAPRGPARCTQPIPSWSASFGPGFSDGVRQEEEGNLSLVREAGSLLVEAAEEDGYLARMRYVFAHGADIPAGTARAPSESSSAKHSHHSACMPGFDEKLAPPSVADGARRLTRTSTLVMPRRAKALKVSDGGNSLSRSEWLGEGTGGCLFCVPPQVSCRRSECVSWMVTCPPLAHRDGLDL